MPRRKRSPRRSEGRFSLGRLRRKGSTKARGAGLIHVSAIADDPFLRELRHRFATLQRRRAA